MKLRVNLSGKNFGSLVVVSFSHRKNGKAHWRCTCECGNETIALGYNLSSGHTTSCGCRRYESNKAIVTHGKSKTMAHATWRRMRQRCSNPNDAGYAEYGGRGIRVCERWNSFENFYADMGDPPKGKSIDRINVDGDYEPSNCRWADDFTQGNNRRNVMRLTRDGVTMTISEWSKHLKLPRTTIVRRLEYGWPLDRVLDPPKIVREDLRTRPFGVSVSLSRLSPCRDSSL